MYRKKMTPQSDMNDNDTNRTHGNERLYAQKEQVYYCFDYAFAIIIVAYFFVVFVSGICHFHKASFFEYEKHLVIFVRILW